MIESEDVAEFMDRDAVKVEDRLSKWTAIGIPADRIVKSSIGLFHVAVAITEDRHGESVCSKTLAENLAVEKGGHLIVTLSRGHR